MDGFDCLGLFIAVSKARLNRIIPDPNCTIFTSIRRSVVDGQHRAYSEVHSPQEGDALLFRYKGFPIHVGYCIDQMSMLHTDPERGCLVERWDSHKWKNRVIGIYRYDVPDNE